ncbi:MAG: GNAT family N-acetyltransferase [Lachnospiraceae bacterium]|nr:GNAT family N-acetyltransferase [Lachnospiraceae bacterium]
MQIREITENKKQYLSLLLLADEQEDMIDRYLERGIMFVLDDGGVKGEYVADRYKGQFSFLQVGTGDSPLTIPFYVKCGFVLHHRIKNFFVENYDHPIVECGVQLVDMIYLRRGLDA